MNRSDSAWPSGVVILLTVAAAAICTVGCGIASGTPLSLVPAVLLVRFVVADYEGAMAAALVAMTALALIALSQGPALFLVAIGGAFAAAELAALAARLHRTGSDAELGRRLIDVGRTVGYGVAALLVGGIATLVDVSTRTGIAALVVVTVGAIAWWAATVFRRPDGGGSAPG